MRFPLQGMMRERKIEKWSRFTCSGLESRGSNAKESDSMQMLYVVKLASALCTISHALAKGG